MIVHAPLLTLLRAQGERGRAPYAAFELSRRVGDAAIASPARLAGRSPAYLARELWDIKSGARNGAAVAQMEAPAKGLSAAQVRDVAAYIGSLDP
jgi:cytochrome c553